MNRPSALKGVLLGTAAATAIGCLALAGCKPNTSASTPSSAPPPLAALPLSTTAAPAVAPGPSTSALPAAPPAPIGQLSDPSQDYAFADRAYAANEGFGDAPPDYTFDYGDGERPWVWQGDDRSIRIAEALPGGGYRYYYYEPGADTPYLIVDADDSYAYSSGRLVGVFDHHGRRVPPGARYAGTAGRLLQRAQQIDDAARRQQHEAVAQANWTARRSQLAQERSQWAADQAANPDWQAYHAAHDQQDQAYWAQERYRREAEAARVADQTNDHTLAVHDWQAAQRAQGAVAPSSQHPGGFFGGGQPPRPQPPTAQNPTLIGPSPQTRHAPVAMNGQAQAGAAAAAAERQAQEQQQAAQRASALAQAQAQAAARKAAEAQAAPQHQAAQQQALAQGQAQEAARRAALQAQARQAEAQAEAKRAVAAQGAAQQQAEAQARAQAAARQAQQAEARRPANANATAAAKNTPAPAPRANSAAKPQRHHPSAAVAPTNQADRP